MTSILVTGGSGFIGRHFCQTASRLGMQLCVLTRNPEAAARRLPDSVQLIGRLSDLSADYTADIILNLAGEPLADGRWTHRRKQKFYDSRINTTDSLFDFFAGRKAAPKLVISGSAIGYYGPGEQAVNETGGVIDGFSHQLCRTWENSAKRFESLGCRICYLRTGIVLGEEGALARMLPAFKLGLGGPIGSGKQWMSWIHIDDMVALILHCINNPQIQGAVNATAPNPVINREFSATLAAVLKRPDYLAMPAIMVKILFGEMGEELLLQGQKVIPAKLLDSGFEFKHANLKAALKNIL
ncbi:MAG: TIGR01777 family oxidoreductase [Porticoccaceae bacterium]